MHYLRDVLSSGNLTSVVFGTEGGVLWTQSQWQMTWCYWIIKSCDLTCVTPSRIPVAVQKLHCGYKLYIRVNQFSGRQLVCTCSRNISSTCCWELSAGELLERLVFCKLQNKQDSFLIKPTICSNFTNFVLAWNSTCFGQFLCPSSGVYSLYIHQWYVCRQLSSRTRIERCLLKSCPQTCMTYTIAECTVSKLLMMDRGTVRNM